MCSQILGCDDLKQKIHDLDMEFTKLVSDLADHCVDKKITPDKLKHHLNFIPGHLGAPITPLWELIIEKIKPDEETVGILRAMHSYLWNFLDYHLIEYLINQFGYQALIIRMKYYTSRINAFKQHTYVVPFMKCWRGQIKYDIPEYVTVQMKHNVTDCKLAELDEVRMDIIKYSRSRNTLPLLSHYATVMYLQTIEKGCICVSWLLLKSFYSEFIQTITDLYDVFKVHNIVSVTHDGKSIYPSQKQRK